MTLQKQPINIDFSRGLDTKTDPFQVAVGNFVSLENMVFDVEKRLTKRNGFLELTDLPGSASLATTFNNNLLAIGEMFFSYSSSTAKWTSKGSFQPLKLNTQSLVKNSTNQSQSDSAISDSGIVCTVFTDNVPSGGSTVAVYKYVVSDYATGQNIISPTAIPVNSGAIAGAPRVFSLGNYFVIIITNLITAVNHLQYIAISVSDPTNIATEVDLSTQYTPSSTLNFDGVVANGKLYLAWNGNDGGGAIRMTSLDSFLNQGSTVVFSGRVATIMSVTADLTGTTPVIYAAFYNSGTSTGYALAVNQNLVTVLAPTQIITTGTVPNITGSAQNGVLTFFYELANNYSYASVATNFIRKNTLTQAGVLGTSSILVRSVGLASKSFLMDGEIYFLSVYSSTPQPTNFLMNSSGKVIAELAYSNARGYYTTGLPQVVVDGNLASVSYLFKDQIIPVNKAQSPTSSAAVYTQTGVNLATFTIGTNEIITSEIGNNLNLTGGFLWMYDGLEPVENGFFLWPDNVVLAGSTTGGTMTAQTYFYQAIYEWTDAKGNIFRSAPSIPVSVTTTGSTSSVTVNVPTLRLTYKTVTAAKIVIYRLSTNQLTYYQVTSVTVPVLNSITVDSVAFIDTQPDTAIIGNSILYTTGGTVENIAGPSFLSISLFKSRLVGIDSEDQNLLWYSKQVIENVPVEMSDLFTIFVPPTTGAQGSTGTLKCLAPMDDKLILFKKDACYYITGTGPDNTGANNDFSEPVFITATVGCSNQASIVFIPNGLMFQSDKGIWLLGRDLSTSYIGAPVEFYNNQLVLSAINIPGTNTVRFTLENGITLNYDYFYNQWGIFTGIPNISSTLFEDLHTYINSFGQVFQENPGSYLDGSRPVLLQFTTGWLNFAGIQGFERAYFFYILGTYISPHHLNLSISFDYELSPDQETVIIPDNASPDYGGDNFYGGGDPYGGPGNLEQWRVFLSRQKVQAFKISLQESFDSTIGDAAGAGFTMSGLNVVAGLKKGYPTIRASRSVG